MPKSDDKEPIFQIDEGFGGQRFKVWATPNERETGGGGGYVLLFEKDRDAWVTIDFDVFDRIAAAVAKSREVWAMAHEIEQPDPILRAESAETLLKQALNLFNGHMNFTVPRERYSSYELAAKIDRHFREFGE